MDIMMTPVFILDRCLLQETDVRQVTTLTHVRCDVKEIAGYCDSESITIFGASALCRALL